jgi:uncharacterized membrane protein YesL
LLAVWDLTVFSSNCFPLIWLSFQLLLRLNPSYQFDSYSHFSPQLILSSLQHSILPVIFEPFYLHRYLLGFTPCSLLTCQLSKPRYFFKYSFIQTQK